MRCLFESVVGETEEHLVLLKQDFVTPEQVKGVIEKHLLQKHHVPDCAEGDSQHDEGRTPVCSVVKMKDGTDVDLRPLQQQCGPDSKGDSIMHSD